MSTSVELDDYGTPSGLIKLLPIGNGNARVSYKSYQRERKHATSLGQSLPKWKDLEVAYCNRQAKTKDFELIESALKSKGITHSSIIESTSNTYMVYELTKDGEKVGACIALVNPDKDRVFIYELIQCIEV